MAIYNPDNPDYFDGSVPWELNNSSRGSPWQGEGDSQNPPPNEPPPTDYTGTNPGSDIFSNLPSWLTGLLPGSGNGQNWRQQAVLPFLTQAYNQYRDSQRYSDSGKAAAQQANPFGTDQRQYYQGIMRDMYENPQKYLDNPAHQAVIQKGLANIGRQDASQGYLGAGKMPIDMIDYATRENNMYLDQEKARISPLTGAQFNPADAARLQMEGDRNSILSRNGALGSLAAIFGQNANTGNGDVTGAGGRTGNTNTDSMLDQVIRGLGQDPSKYNYQQIMGLANKLGISPSQLLTSSYWRNYLVGNYNAGDIANQENLTHTGNLTPDQQYDEFGTPNPNYTGDMGPPVPDDYGFEEDYGNWELPMDYGSGDWWSISDPSGFIP